MSSHRYGLFSRVLNFNLSATQRREEKAARAAYRRRSHRMGIRLFLDQLETRALMTGSPIIGPTVPMVTTNLQLKPGMDVAPTTLLSLIYAAGGSAQTTQVSGLYEIQSPASNISALVQNLSASSAVQYAQSQQMVQIATVPNDPNFTNGSQWGLNGTWGINAPAAWAATTGSNSVIVADVDTGINYNNADLINNVWLNQAEIPTTVLSKLSDVNGDGFITFSDLNNPVNIGPGKIVDTNGDGVITGTDVIAKTSSGGWASGSTKDGATSYPDDLIGWNFVTGTDNPLDDNNHGTHTAGIIGAVGNNGIGVTGVAWNTQVMALKFMDASGSGSDSAASAAIHYAVDHGAKVINASWGGSGVDSTVASAIQYADSKGVIVVAAAGNSGANDDTSFFFPASYSATYANMITVAAIDSTGALAGFSNYGTSTVALAAPGVNILSTYGSGYATLSGTSMAAPFVAGTVALVEAAHPTWSMSQVIDAVVDHTTPDPALVGKVTSGGVVNAGAAVANTDGAYVVSSTPNGQGTAASPLSSVQLTFNEEINPATFTASQVVITGPSGAIGGITISAVSGSNNHKFLVSFTKQTAGGTYTLKVGPSIKDWYGNSMDQNRNGVNSESADQFVLNVGQITTDRLSVVGIPTITSAGVSQTFVVTALLSTGLVDTSFTQTVSFSSTDSQAVLPAIYTFTTADLGVHTFTVMLKTAGNQSITATDPVTPVITGSESGISVQPAAASSLTVTGFPSPDAAGAAGYFTVTAFDQYGNVATGYSGTVHFTSSDPLASLPSNYTFTATDTGKHIFSATLKTTGTQSITATGVALPSVTGTDTVAVVVSVSASATLLNRDASTQGNWIGVYGSQGYNVIGNAASYPTYATVTPSGQTSYSWAASTTDPRALQTAGGSGRIAACWYAPSSFSINLNLTDGLTHNVALYAVDWDSNSRSEQIQITSASTGVSLDTETLSSFSGGTYLQWAITGNVVIKFVCVSGANAVVSGLFIDPSGSAPPPPPPPPSASFIDLNTKTQGNWIGTYGSQSYDIVGNAASNASYATITSTGQSTYTWAASTSDPRALQTAGGSGRIAACWYASAIFSINVKLTDGQSHNLALYAVDWDSTTRSEQIQITNAATGAVLDTETLSSFSGGAYLTWRVTGNIVITFTKTAGANAVVSGLFLDPSTSASSTASASTLRDSTPLASLNAASFNPVASAIGTLDFSNNDQAVVPPGLNGQTTFAGYNLRRRSQ